MKKSMIVRGVLALFGAFLLVVAPLEAQRSDGARRGVQGQDRARLEQRLRARMGEMMQEQLGLTPDEGAALGEVVEEYEARRRDLGRQEMALRRRVEALLLEGNQAEEEARGLLTRMIELGEQETALQAAEHQALLEVLTPTQVLRLYGLRQQIGERIRRLRGGQDGRRGGGPPGEGVDGNLSLLWEGVPER